MERSMMDKRNADLRVAGLHRIALTVPNLNETESFYRDAWRLLDTGSQGKFKAFRTRASHHDDFLLAEGPRGIDHVAFTVTSAEALRELSGRLAGAGFEPAEVARDRLFAGDRQAVAARDPEGRAIWLVLRDLSETAGTAAEKASGPQRIGHVVFWTTASAETERFLGLLGFQVTDRTNAGMSFLRCNSDHHTVALAKSPSGKTGIQHIAFDVGSLDEVMRNYGRLRTMGIECAWGVGRHGPGNNVFSYYADPAGHFAEYYGDMEKCPVGETVETKFWGPEHKGDIWGVAGIPPLAFRE
jgi:catechol 2,3-dioxygenase-like lactoylglutathione lyase family enzyme